MKEDEMKQIAIFIGRVLKDKDNAQLKADVKAEVKALASGYPLYPDAV
jgi:glycine/serine hydroxymethyltransferase